MLPRPKHDCLRKFVSENGILRSKRLLKRRYELSLLDREHCGKRICAISRATIIDGINAILGRAD